MVMFVRERHFSSPEYLSLSNAQLTEIIYTTAKTYLNKCACNAHYWFHIQCISWSSFFVLRVRLNIMIVLIVEQRERVKRMVCIFGNIKERLRENYVISFRYINKTLNKLKRLCQSG
jgi:hypothetical protein